MIEVAEMTEMVREGQLRRQSWVVGKGDRQAVRRQSRGEGERERGGAFAVAVK